MDLCFHVITNGDQNRMATTQNAFERYGFKYKWVQSKKHHTNGKLGCFKSHLKLFKYAKKNNLEYIAIGEDNLINMNETLPLNVANDIKILLPTNEWSIVLLGGWFVPFSTYGPNRSTLYRTSSIHGTSCYIIHKRLYLSILNNYK